MPVARRSPLTSVPTGSVPVSNLSRLVLGAVASAIIASPLEALCSEHIRRSDGTDFHLIETVTNTEGGTRFSIGIGRFSIDITLDGGELVQYGQYRAKDGTTVLVRCRDIGEA